MKNKSEDMDWENRTLCSDDNCIGVIGPDGRCSECGSPGTGSPDQGLPEADDFSTDETPDDDVSAEDHAPVHPEETIDQGPEALDWENRTLCSDGNCIGVIGPDGRCSECGKPGSGASEGS